MGQVSTRFNQSGQHTGVYNLIPEMPKYFLEELREINNSSGSQVTPRVYVILYPKNKLVSDSIKSTKNQLNDLRNYVGFNISELASILRVQRPTIYEWLESDNEPSKRNQERVAKVYGLFMSWFNKSNLISIRNFLHKKVEKRSLFDLLSDKILEEQPIKELLEKIEDKIRHIQKQETEHETLLKKEGFKPISREECQKTLEQITRWIG